MMKLTPPQAMVAVFALSCQTASPAYGPVDIAEMFMAPSLSRVPPGVPGGR